MQHLCEKSFLSGDSWVWLRVDYIVRSVEVMSIIRLSEYCCMPIQWWHQMFLRSLQPNVGYERCHIIFTNSSDIEELQLMVVHLTRVTSELESWWKGSESSIDTSLELYDQDHLQNISKPFRRSITSYMICFILSFYII